MFYINFLTFFFILYIIVILSSFCTVRFFNVNFFVLSCSFCLFGVVGFLICLWTDIFFFQNVWTFTNLNILASLNFVPSVFSLEINILNYCFFFLVAIIGACTNVYLFNYFKGEANEFLFTFWLNSFIISMMILVLAGNLFTLFLGWELIGLTSFFLINFWSFRRSTLKSSFKAFVFNLFSDICLLGFCLIFYYIFGTDDISSILYLSQYGVINTNFLLTFGTILLIACCCIKSVQLFGHLWLPDSMEAPVPASSLIHSATLVSAGIYLICKFYYVIYLCLDISWLINIGAVTAVYGALVCTAQTDLKKLLAYSTMSHCGFLWVLAFSGNCFITILYLFLHGLYKAATFYCTGSFIRAFNTQDSRLMGQGLKILPVDSFFLLFCSANLSGLPFTVGFVYKLFFLKLLILSTISWFSVGMLFIASLCGLVYFYRLNYYLLTDFYKNIKNMTFMYFSKSKIFLVKNFCFTNLNFLLASSFLFIISCLTIFIYYFWLKTNFILNNNFFIENLSIFYFYNLEKYYNIYYYLFYFIYFLIFLWITFVSLKQNQNLLEITFLIYYFLLIVFILCELTLWRMPLL